jgi:pteridine reductase
VEEEEWEQEEEEGAGARSRIFSGIKGGFAIFIALPFIIILLPVWYLYRRDKIRSGQPVPEAPWAALFNKQEANPKRPKRVSRPYSEESISYPGKAAREEGSELDSFVPKPESGRVALVTGGGQRIGAAICRDLASMGYVVAVVYHKSEQAAQKTVAAIVEQGGRADCFPLDLRNPAQIESILNEVSRKLGPVDLLINNASLFLPTPKQGGRWEVMEGMFQVNLQGPMMLAMAAINKMESRGGGLIINMCDIWAEKPLRGHAAYSAAKAGLISATQVLARDAAPEVRVNAIAPGAVLPPDDKSELASFQKSLARTPLARESSPDAVLQAVRYLLTAHYVTGEVLHVDGGRRLV